MVNEQKSVNFSCISIFDTRRGARVSAADGWLIRIFSAVILHRRSRLSDRGNSDYVDLGKKSTFFGKIFFAHCTLLSYLVRVASRIL